MGRRTRVASDTASLAGCRSGDAGKDRSRVNGGRRKHAFNVRPVQVLEVEQTSCKPLRLRVSRGIGHQFRIANDTLAAIQHERSASAFRTANTYDSHITQLCNIFKPYNALLIRQRIVAGPSNYNRCSELAQHRKSSTIDAAKLGATTPEPTLA
jgi:hypothetical protein